MPVLADFIYDYIGLLQRPAHCCLRIYRLASGMVAAIATELDDNPGTSITNYAEQLVTQCELGTRRRGRPLCGASITPPALPDETSPYRKITTAVPSLRSW